MPLTRLVQRTTVPVQPTPDRVPRGLARSGWTAADLRALQAACGAAATEVLAAVQDDAFPDRAPGTVLAWLRAGGDPLIAALRDPDTRRRQALGMQSWSRTFGELGPAAHAAGLSLAEAVHLLAAGALTREALHERAAGRPQAAVLASWADPVLRPSS